MITCKNDDHTYVLVRRITNNLNEPDERIMWCTKCGAIKIDAYYDNRLIGHYCVDPRYPTGEETETVDN